jgi:DNA-binding ferritin-like protein (Dps family)
VRKINKLGKRAAALVLAVGLTLSTAAPVLAADADEVETPAAQTEQQETDTEADEADVDTEADEAAALPELSEDREVAEEDEAAALPELSEDREVAEEDEAVALPELSEDRAAAGADEAIAARINWCDILGHKWGEEYGYEEATCQHGSYAYHKCERCGKVDKVDKGGVVAHKYTTYTVTKEATDGEDGEQVAYCDYGCETKKTQIIHYYGEWEVTKEATCYAKGEKKRTCLNCGYVETAEIKTIPHTWGEYVDDDKPGCQQQTATAHCTVEGCTATDTEDRPNFGADGNPLPHKFTTYKKESEIKYVSTCDYCHEEKKYVNVWDKEVITEGATNTAIKNVKLDGKTADAYVDAVIDKALANAQEAVKNAKTKEEALAALDQISSTVKSELSSVTITVAGVGGDVTISEKDLNKALAPLDSTVADLKSSLNDSFLSQDTITNMVDKLAGDVQDSSAPQAGIKQILHNTVYDAIYNLGVSDDKKKTTDNTQAISDMVLQLVKEVVQSDKGWNDLTGSLVDDAVDLAVDELMKDKTYAKLLKTKLGAATMEEVRAEVRKQLVEDPEFMNQVRGIASKAVDNAQKGVNAGWSNEKIMNRLQADLLPDVTDLISNQVNKLGASAGDIVDNKVSDTVHKFLPGKLGDWVSDKIGGKVNDAVTGKVDDLNKQVTDLISTTIKQLTCTHEWGDRETLKNPTCTEKGQTGVVCHKCGKVKDKKDDLEPTGHTPVTDPAVAPTETTDGLTEGSHCSVCGAVLTAQEVIPMRDPTIDTWFSRAATTEADAKAAGFDSVDAANAALDAALTAAGFDPANAEHFTVQVNSSIGVLPNDRFSESGVTGKLTLPEGTRGKTAQTYYAVQMFTADTRFHKAGDVVVTPVSIDTYAKTGLQFTVYSEAVMAIAWKAQ